MNLCYNHGGRGHGRPAANGANSIAAAAAWRRLCRLCLNNVGLSSHCCSSASCSECRFSCLAFLVHLEQLKKLAHCAKTSNSRDGGYVVCCMSTDHVIEALPSLMIRWSARARANHGQRNETNPNLGRTELEQTLPVTLVRSQYSDSDGCHELAMCKCRWQCHNVPMSLAMPGPPY